MSEISCPPLYTFLYGVYARLVGLGPCSCILYHVLSHLLLVWSAVALARTVYALPWSLSALCGALLIALGTVGRPDELGVVLAMWGAVVFRPKIPRRSSALTGGALLGLREATSLGALLHVGPLVMWELPSEGEARADMARNLSLPAMGVLAAAAACVVPILASHPTAFQQLIANAESTALGFVTGQGQNSHRQFLEIWAGALPYGYTHCVLIMGLMAFAVLCWRFDRSRKWAGYTRILFAALWLLFLVVLMPGRCFYTWFPGSCSADAPPS